MKSNQEKPEKDVVPAQDKIHPMFENDGAADKNLLYNAEKDSYEIDRKSDDPDYDHPLPYDTVAEDGGDDNSSYDEANPYVGGEYLDKEQQIENGLDDLGMRIDNSDDIVTLSTEDELLARTPEDKRNDLDEEGYPKNDLDVKN